MNDLQVKIGGLGLLGVGTLLLYKGLSPKKSFDDLAAEVLAELEDEPPPRVFTAEQRQRAATWVEAMAGVRLLIRREWELAADGDVQMASRIRAGKVRIYGPSVSASNLATECRAALQRRHTTGYKLLPWASVWDVSNVALGQTHHATPSRGRYTRDFMHIAPQTFMPQLIDRALYDLRGLSFPERDVPEFAHGRTTSIREPIATVQDARALYELLRESRDLRIDLAVAFLAESGRHVRRRWAESLVACRSSMEGTVDEATTGKWTKLLAKINSPHRDRLRRIEEAGALAEELGCLGDVRFGI